MQSNDDSFSQPGNESTGSRPSAGLSESNNSRSIARMHQQVCTSFPINEREKRVRMKGSPFDENMLLSFVMSMSKICHCVKFVVTIRIISKFSDRCIDVNFKISLLWSIGTWW
jgi:hypothetical protein